MQRHHIGIALSVALITAAGWYFLMSREAVAPVPANDAEDGDIEEETSEQLPPVSSMRIGEYAIYAPDQKAGETVLIPLVALGKPGFVAVYSSRNNSPDQRLGVSELLPEGESEMVSVILTRPSRDSETLHALLFVDDGDTLFDAAEGKDLPARDGMENDVMMDFVIDNNAAPPPQIAI